MKEKEEKNSELHIYSHLGLLLLIVIVRLEPIILIIHDVVI